MKSQNELATLFRKYHSAKVAADTAKALSAEIKDELNAMGVKTYTAGGFIATVVTPKDTTSFDATAFKADYPELYAQYCVTKPSAQRLNFK